MSAFKYPVVRVHPTHSEIISEHLTKADAEQAAAYLDFIAEDAGVWHCVCEPDEDTDHARAD